MTIKSVVSQSYKNLEYIIIDGGSTDSTMEIVNRYRPHITTIVSEKDNGLYDAMNKGLKMATGEWIIFINAGDVFASPDVLQNIFNTPIEDECSLIFGGITQYSLLLKVKHTDPAPIWPQENGPFPYRETMPGFHQATFYRTELLKKHPYRCNEYKIAADWASMIDILDLKKPYKVVNTTIAWYQVGGISTEISFSHFREREKIKGYQFQWKAKIQMIVLYRLRKLIIKIIPKKISTALRKKYFEQKLGFIALTEEDIRQHLYG